MRIDIKKLRKNFADKQIFSIDAFSFESGLIHGIIGANGTGKTTLLRILSGVEPHYQGDVFYDEKRLEIALQKNITFLSQSPYMMNRTVLENIAYPLKIRKIPKSVISDKAEEAMKLMKVKDLSHRNATSLSTGETQKVALARALIIEPKLLLLDEPTANIDPESMLIIEEVLQKYNELTECTIISVTHNVEQAKRFCQKIIKMADGDVKEWVI
jgi:ABC-type sugar transport systems, ATPase components